MTQEQKEFIERISKIATADMAKTKILASLTISQAILESNWGNSGLTKIGNALFGIKAGSSWRGAVYTGKTIEYYDGKNPTSIVDNFRAYKSWEESVTDHSALLNGISRYKNVIGENDYRKACTEIWKAGYATDPTYPQKLIKLIEQYNLNQYDKSISFVSNSVMTKLYFEKGDKGNDVTNIQIKLNAHGYKGSNGKSLVVDGDFGINTDFAVRAFQKAKKLVVDGKVGQKTLVELNK